MSEPQQGNVNWSPDFKHEKKDALPANVKFFFGEIKTLRAALAEKDAEIKAFNEEHQRLDTRIKELEAAYSNSMETALTYHGRLSFLRELLDEALAYVRSDYNPGTPAYKLVERWEQMKKEWELP